MGRHYLFLRRRFRRLRRRAVGALTGLSTEEVPNISRHDDYTKMTITLNANRAQQFDPAP